MKIQIALCRSDLRRQVTDDLGPGGPILLAGRIPRQDRGAYTPASTTAIDGGRLKQVLSPRGGGQETRNCLATVIIADGAALSSVMAVIRVRVSVFFREGGVHASASGRGRAYGGVRVVPSDWGGREVRLNPPANGEVSAHVSGRVFRIAGSGYVV